MEMLQSEIYACRLISVHSNTATARTTKSSKLANKDKQQ